jgi:hypothetical protein
VSTLSTHIQHSFGIPNQSYKIRRKNKNNSNRKGRSQIILICRWHDLIAKRPKTLHQKLLDFLNTCSKVAGYKINVQKSVAFLYTNNEQIYLFLWFFIRVYSLYRGRFILTILIMLTLYISYIAPTMNKLRKNLGKQSHLK